MHGSAPPWTWAMAIASALAPTAPLRADDGATPLAPVVVSATRVPADPFDLPASVSVADADADDTAQAGLADAVRGVPGLIARERQNFAQDEQISIRGFGSRATFGVRGVRLYVDGIPATMPDGQGQTDAFPLSAVQRIEVLRGPFAALYGNAAGGVVQLFTEDGAGPARWRAAADIGSHATWRTQAALLGSDDRLDYHVDVSRFATDTDRDHAHAQRSLFNAKFNLGLAPGQRLSLVANALALPEAQDPLGLTPAQYRADPRQAAAPALSFDTRKRVAQQQLGLVYTREDGAQSQHLAVYAGQRAVRQFQSIPVAVQQSPTSPGGAIDLDGGFGGIDARWRSRWSPGAQPLDVIVGFDLERQAQRRRGYDNYLGDTLGVLGALRRDERDRVEEGGFYLQAQWTPAPRWSLDLGLRRSRVRFRVRDDFVAPSNPDDSGARRYDRTLPIMGLLWRVSPDWRCYVAAGQAFETPSFNELGYRADGSAGLNLALQPALTANAEIGAKHRFGAGAEWDIALFQARSRDELAVFSSGEGRTSYQNVPRARRDGVEMGLDLPWRDVWHIRAAYTYLRARFDSGFGACAGTPCTAPQVWLPRGQAIPGVPRQHAFGDIDYRGLAGWRIGVEAEAFARVAANDLGTVHAPGYGVANVVIERERTTRHWRLAAYARLDNAFDRRYVGSVIVNESNGRYFEPGAGRTLLLGLRVEGRGADTR